jgi:hypothetical protein
MPTPNIPALSSKVDPEIRRAFTALKSWFEGAGNDLSAQDLVATGMFTQGRDGSLQPNAPFLDMTVPPQITGFTVTGAFSAIMLSWDDPRYRNLAYVEVFRAEVDNLGVAVRIGTTQSTQYADTPPRSSLSETYFYWVRVVSQAGVFGPFNGTSGTPGSTANDPSYVLELLTGQIRESQLYADLQAKIDLSGPMALIQQTLDTLIGETALASVVTSVNNEEKIVTETITRVQAIEQEVFDRAEAILAEAMTREDAVTAAMAAIAEESSVRHDADSAEVRARETLAAKVDDNKTELAAVIDNESSVRATADEAEATARETLAAKVDTDRTDLIALINDEQTVRVTQDDALAKDTKTLSSSFGGAGEGLLEQVVAADGLRKMTNALILQEQSTRTTADLAEATARETLAAKVDTNNANITALVTQETATRATADDAIANTVSTLAATVNTNKADLSAMIVAESSARADADTAEATARTTLAARVTDAETDIATNTAAIGTEQTVRAEQDDAIAKDAKALTSSFGTSGEGLLSQVVAADALRKSTNAYIVQEQSTRAAADLAEANSRTALAATVNSNNTNLTALVLNESNARATADTAIANSVASVQTKVNDQTTTVQALATSVGGIQGEYTIKIDANGNIASIGLINGPGGSKFGILADQLFVIFPNAPAYSSSATYKKGARVSYGTTGTPPLPKQWRCIVPITTPEAWNAAHWDDTLTPFIVDSQYGVVIDTALIKDGTITSAQIQSLSADKLVVPGTASIWDAIITTGKITNAYIGDTIQSTSYTPGPGGVGWKIDKAGTIRGQGIIVEDASITSLKLAGNAVTVPDYGIGVSTFAQCSVTVTSDTPVNVVAIGSAYCPVGADITIEILAPGSSTWTPMGFWWTITAPYTGYIPISMEQTLSTAGTWGIRLNNSSIPHAGMQTDSLFVLGTKR